MAQYRSGSLNAGKAAHPRPWTSRHHTANQKCVETDLASELRRQWLVHGLSDGQGATLAMAAEACGYGVTVIDDAAEVRTQVSDAGGPVDGVLIDAGPTDIEGTRLCRHLRRAGTWIPLLLMGDWSNLHAVVAGLESGATDFMPRECPTNIVVARMRCHLRNHDGSEHATFPLGGLRFHPASRTVIEPGGKRRVRLTVVETRMLQYLLERGGVTISREVLAEGIWDDATQRDSPLDPVVRELQQKIQLAGGRVMPQRVSRGHYQLLRRSC